MSALSPWLEARRQGLSSSDLAAVLGFSKRRSARMVAREKRGETRERDDREPSEDMYWGNVMEPHVIAAYCERRQMTQVHPSQWAFFLRCHVVHLEHEGRTRSMLFSKTNELFRCTPDFVALDNVNRPWIGEAKTTGVLEAWKGGAPTHVKLQLWWHLFVGGVQNGAIPALLFGRRRKMVVFESERNPKLEAAALANLPAWGQRHVVDGVEPDAMRADLPQIKDDNKAESGRTIELPAVPFLTVDESWVKAKDSAAKWIKHKEIAEAILRDGIGTASFGRIEGSNILYSLHTTANGGRTLRRKLVACQN